MKKTKWLFSILLAVALIFTGCSLDEMNDIQPDVSVPDVLKSVVVDGLEIIPCGQETYTLWAGQTTDAGTVVVSNDETNLYVTVTSPLGFSDVDEEGNPVDEHIKMWLGTDLELVNKAGESRPSAGLFPEEWKYTVPEDVTTHTFVIKLQDISTYDASVCGEQDIYVLVHADVLAPDGNGGTTAETAWSGDVVGLGNGWWNYSIYIPECCSDVPQDEPEYGLETAFAYGNYVFVSPIIDKKTKEDSYKNNPNELDYLKLTKNRWGWANFITENIEVPIYAGAGLNNTDNATNVGTATIEFTATGVDITYNVTDGTLKEVHFYVNDVEPNTIAPGQYGHTEYFDPMGDVATATFNVVDVNGDGVWVILHGVVAI